MNLIAEIEFYSTPEGDVMIKEESKAARLFVEGDRELITQMLQIIRDRYVGAFDALMDLYSKYSRNRWLYEYNAIHRFVRCNFGEYDLYNRDIDHLGRFMFEEVKCPLRGECKYECVICKPVLNTTLTEREKEVFRLIAYNMQAEQIKDELNISINTVHRHRENIKAKIGAKSVGEMISYWNINNLK